MVTHHRKPQNLNSHHTRQKFHSLPNEFPTMLVVRSGQRILSAEKSPPNASIDSMHDLNFTIRQHIPPIRACHDQTPQNTEIKTSNLNQLGVAKMYRFTRLPSMDGWPQVSPKAVLWTTQYFGWPPSMGRSFPVSDKYKFCGKISRQIAGEIVLRVAACGQPIVFVVNRLMLPTKWHSANR